jgi:DNA-binding MarR family transcriptional regulator
MSHRGPFILIFALDQQLSTLLGRAMEGAPLSPQVFAITSVLRLTGPVRPTALAETVGMRPTSLSNYLRRLTESGLVRRRPDPADGRAALVSLTAKGVRETEACFPSFGAAITSFQRFLAEEGVDELATLEIMEGMSRALTRATAELEPAAESDQVVALHGVRSNRPA